MKDELDKIWDSLIIENLIAEVTDYNDALNLISKERKHISLAKIKICSRILIIEEQLPMDS